MCGNGREEKDDPDLKTARAKGAEKTKRYQNEVRRELDHPFQLGIRRERSISMNPPP
jgi:hypothetical protein